MSYFHPSLLVDDTGGAKGENSATASTSSADSWITDFSHFGLNEIYGDFQGGSVALNSCYRLPDKSSKSRSVQTPLTKEPVAYGVPAVRNEPSKSAHPHSPKYKSENALRSEIGGPLPSRRSLFEHADVGMIQADSYHSSSINKHLRTGIKSLSCEKLSTQCVNDEDKRSPTHKNRTRHKFMNSASRTNVGSTYPRMYEGNQQPVKMKTKLKSLWENMKYGWRVKQHPSFSNDSPIWLLGRYYHTKLYDTPQESTSGSYKPEDMRKISFKKDLSSLIWLTYRYNFPPLSNTDLTTDSGWGCMLRAGQMIMGQGLVCHLLGRDWHLTKDKIMHLKHRDIIRWFADSPSVYCPFSIHKLVTVGMSYGRKAGEWYGPAHIIHVLREALLQESQRNYELKDLCVYATPDGIVFKQDIVDLCTASQPVHLIQPCEPFSNRLPPSQIPPLEHRPQHCFSTEISKDAYSSQVSSNAVLLKTTNTSIKECDAVECVELANKTGNVPLEPYNSTCDKDSSFKIPLCESLQNTGSGEQSLFPSITSSEHQRQQNGKKMTFSSSQNFALLSNSVWKSVIIFIAVRLGNDRINPFYIPSLKSLLTYEHCLGIIGGRPKHAVYFVGWHGNKLIHLDPHFCQVAEDITDPESMLKSYHCSSPCTMSFNDMDPSCAIGFYLKTKDDFEEFTERIMEMSTSVKRNMEYPIFALSEGRRADAEASCTFQENNHAYSREGVAAIEQDDDGYIVL